MAAAATFKDVRVRVGAARLVLSDQSRTPNHKAFSSLQSAALASLVQTATLDDQEKAEAASLVAGMAWFSTEHCTRVLDSLTPTAATSHGSAAKKRRRELQDFTAFLSYGHTDFWKLVSSGSVPAANKLHVICQFLLKLGLRLPTEHTCKLVTSFWMVQAHSDESLSLLSATQKVVYLNHVKKTFDGLRKQAGDPLSWIDRLPTEPLEMCQQFPGIFNSTFHSGLQPIVSPVDLSTVIAVDQSYGCRGGNRPKVQMPENGIVAASGINSGSKDAVLQLSPRRHESSIERVACQMLGQMQQMAASQQRMFEMFLGNGQPSNLRSLNSIADKGFLEDRPQQMRGNGFLEDRPPQMRPMQHALMAPPPPGTVQEVPLAEHAAPSPLAGVAADSQAELETPDDLQRMLDAMQDRKRDKALAAKAVAAEEKMAAAVAKVAAVPKPTTPKKATPSKATKKKKKAAPAKLCAAKKETPAVPAEVATPPSCKKPATLPIKAISPKEVSPKAEAAKAMKEVSPKAKAASPKEVSPKAKAAKAASPKVSPKAKAIASVSHLSVKEKTAAKVIAVQGTVVIGCAKCRYFWRGCSQCRSADFTGFRWNAFVKE